jgi:hypothetical protein
MRQKRSGFHPVGNDVTECKKVVNPQPLSIVIRIPDVTLSRADLETALGLPLDRYEQPADSASAYAQIDIPDGGDQWAAALDCVQSVRDPIQRLVSESLIGSPSLDVAAGFPSSALSTSLTVPARLAAAAGETGIDIDISIYRTGTV